MATRQGVAPALRTAPAPPASDYLQPPKVTRKMEIGLQRFDEIAEDIAAIKASHPHERPHILNRMWPA
jgi:hypothetical protein